MDTNKNLCIYSYNSRGFSMEKQEVCKKLINSGSNEITILCNQENFLLKANGYIIEQTLPGYHILFKPAKKDFLEGRPKNGMFVAIPAELKSKVKEISLMNERLQAMTLDTGNSKILIINVYFPNDPKTVNYIVNEDLEDILASITDVIENSECTDVIIAGDFNIDFNRKNGHAKRLHTFLKENELKSLWKKFDIDFTHEFEVQDASYTCIIDHIACNEKLMRKMKAAGVMHLVENTSDHSPIYCKVEEICFGELTEQEEGNTNTNVKLKTMTDDDWDNFRRNLENSTRYAEKSQ